MTQRATRGDAARSPMRQDMPRSCGWVLFAVFSVAGAGPAALKHLRLGGQSLADAPGLNCTQLVPNPLDVHPIRSPQVKHYA